MFDNFISLGYYCGVAASMSKIGIRSISGPFDWYISSNFEGVLKCLKDDFSDFLVKENIEVMYTGMSFIDTKHAFHLGHEIKISFEAEYDSIYEKYMRRIQYFREQIKQKTCFIRAVYDDDELQYIQENQKLINEIVKKANADNEIVYVISKNIYGSGRLAFSHYLVDSYESGNRKELRGLFDQSKELCNFCTDNYDENKRYKNMVFDLRKEIYGLEYRYNLMDKIDRMDLRGIELPDKIIIYGAGRIGKYFYQKIKGSREVLFFIDKSSQEKIFDGVPIIRYGNSLYVPAEVPVVVSACYEYIEIRTNLLNRYGEMKIVSLLDL